MDEDISLPTYVLSEIAKLQSTHPEVSKLIFDHLVSTVKKAKENPELAKVKLQIMQHFPEENSIDIDASNEEIIEIITILLDHICNLDSGVFLRSAIPIVLYLNSLAILSEQKEINNSLSDFEDAADEIEDLL